MSAVAAAIAEAMRSGALESTHLAERSGVLLHVPSLRSRTLNPAGMALLDAIARGAETEAALADRLIAAHATDRDGARRDVAAFLSALAELLDPTVRPVTAGGVPGGARAPSRRNDR